MISKRRTYSTCLVARRLQILAIAVYSNLTAGTISMAQTPASTPVSCPPPMSSVEQANPRDTETPDKERLCWVAERAIESADRALSILLWLLGLVLGGTAVSVITLYTRISRFLSKAKADMQNAVETVSVTSEIYEQMMRNVPLLIVPGVDDESRTVAISTLAQLRRPEFCALFAQLLRDSKSPTVKRAAIYAMRMLGEPCRDWLSVIIEASKSTDFQMRRECVKTFSASGCLTRDVEERLEEMRGDADTVVQQLAVDALTKLRSELRQIP